MAGPILNSAIALAQREGQQPQPFSMTQPAPHTEAKWPYAAIALGQLGDAASTIAATHGGLQEQNPMGVAGTLAAKAAATAALMYVMHHEAVKGHDGLQKAIGIIGGALGAGPAIWNMTQMAKQK